jgi:hypothetical protein
MSKYINVNPDHYKLAGRERPGDATASAPKRLPKAGGDERLRERWQKKQREKARGRNNLP